MTWLLRSRASLTYGFLWAVLLFIPFSEAKQLWQSLEYPFSQRCVVEQSSCAQTTQASPIPEKQSSLTPAVKAVALRSVHLSLKPQKGVADLDRLIRYRLEFSEGSPRGPPVRG